MKKVTIHLRRKQVKSGSQLKKCNICGVQVSEKRLKKHKVKCIKGKKIGDLPAAERRKALREKFGPDADHKPFNSRRTINAGAFGLGRSRKH